MYDDLVMRLREAPSDWPYADLHYEAADAIETMCEMVAKAHGELANVIQSYEESKPKWIVFESRPMDAEERQYYSEHYGYELTDDEAVIYCSEMPDHDQEVLVCNEYGSVWIDRFDDDPDYGVGFETNGDMDGLVAWMPKPKPYEPPKEE